MQVFFRETIPDMNCASVLSLLLITSYILFFRFLFLLNLSFRSNNDILLLPKTFQRETSATTAYLKWVYVCDYPPDYLYATVLSHFIITLYYVLLHIIHYVSFYYNVLMEANSIYIRKVSDLRT